jgi:hypothetical protein
VDAREPDGVDRAVADTESNRPALQPAYLDLYKLAVEMADRVSARRSTANSFFLAVQTALVTLLGVEGLGDDAVAGAGLVLASAWWLLLRSYRKLNAAKFKVIGEMEEALPVQIFNEEWKRLRGQDPQARARARDRYAELGIIEQLVPAVFAVIYAITILFS